MTIDLTIGFREKPKGLERMMSTMGYALEKVTPADATFSCRMDSYRFFDEHRSRRGVLFVYHNGTYEDHSDIWQEIVDSPADIVATGSVTTYMGRSASDLKKQRQTARFLRDHYNAVLYDPQSEQVITD